MAEQLHDPDLGPTKASEYTSSVHPNLDCSAYHGTLSNEADHPLMNPNPHSSTAQIDSTLNATNDDPPIQEHHVPQLPNQTYGKLRRKKHLNETDLLAVVAGLLCLIAAVVTISPRFAVAWRLGLKRQVSHHCLLIMISE